MRIISGKYKHRKIAPSGLSLRPTTDFARESLFNIFNSYLDVEDLDILDLCAGSGTMGFEFLSRGAAHVTAVDIDEKCISFITKTAAKLGEPNLKAIKRDAFTYLTTCRQSFDIIFADPPFEMQGIEKIHKLVFEKNLLNPNGWLIIEHAERTELKDCNRLFQKRTYGKVNFSIFINNNDEEETNEKESKGE